MVVKRITSPQNPHVKLAARLRDRRGRDQQQRMLIDGVREIACALQSGIHLAEVYFDPDRSAGEPVRTLLAETERAGGTLFETTAGVLAKLAYGDRNEGLVAVGVTPPRDLNSLHLGAAPLVVVLEGLEKPGNVGAVLRTCDAAGVDGLILASPQTDLFNPNTIRASLGAVFAVNCCAAASPAVRDWLVQRGLVTYAARVDGALAHYDADFCGPCALVLGSETSGLSSVWGPTATRAVRIPMAGRVDSLNVSVTAAVLLYEALRQRRQHRQH
jgi:TrmH family RNA methyltransferase